MSKKFMTVVHKLFSRVQSLLSTSFCYTFDEILKNLQTFYFLCSVLRIAKTCPIAPISRK